MGDAEEDVGEFEGGEGEPVGLGGEFAGFAGGEFLEAGAGELGMVGGKVRGDYLEGNGLPGDALAQTGDFGQELRGLFPVLVAAKL